MIKAIVKEYGIGWAINRFLYLIKLKMLRRIPVIEGFFEKKKKVVRLDVFDIDVETLMDIISSLPEQKQQELLQEAERATKGIIKGFSSVELDYGYPINWQLNPLTGYETNNQVKWYNIPDFDERRGDIKVIWEVSRFCHFVTLARAYCLTKDVKYYNAFSEQLEEWVAQNEYSFGANYKCGQECSIRMVNLLLAYSVFKKQDMITARDEENARNVVEGSYRKVLSNFFYAYKCIKNNHTLSELMGMIVGAWCSDDKLQLKKAGRYLNIVIKEQFSQDGGYAQFSFNYQRLALMDINLIYSLADKTQIRFKKDIKDRVLKSALMLYQCQNEKGDVPNYGSNDGALIYKLTSCGYRDFRPVCNTTFKLLTGKDLYEEGIYREELAWLGTKDPYDLEEIAKESYSYPEAGIFILRGHNNFIMMVSNLYKSRPAHMDQLHIDLWVNDINILCDGGTFSYASALGRNLISTASHNTVCVNGLEQMSIKPPFLIYDWTKRINYEIGENHIGSSMQSKNGYNHKRDVWKRQFGYEIVDEVSGAIKKGYDIQFHTICRPVVDGSIIRLMYDGRLMCSIETENAYEIGTAKRSIYYLQQEDISCITIHGNIDNKEITTKIIMEE